MRIVGRLPEVKTTNIQMLVQGISKKLSIQFLRAEMRWFETGEVGGNSCPASP